MEKVTYGGKKYEFESEGMFCSVAYELSFDKNRLITTDFMSNRVIDDVPLFDGVINEIIDIYDKYKENTQARDVAIICLAHKINFLYDEIKEERENKEETGLEMYRVPNINDCLLK